MSDDNTIQVLRIGGILHTHPEWEEVSRKFGGGFTVYEKGGSRDDFIKECKDGKFKRVRVIARSNDSTGITGPFDKELISALPESCKFICHNGAGYNNIDVDACSKCGISVSSTPTAVDGATADITIFLIIGALRRIGKMMKVVHQKGWPGADALGHDPAGKTLGILGMGGIGRDVAKRALALGMTIQYHNRNRLSSDLETISADVKAKYVSFDDLISTSDVISVNLALTPQTKHIISTKEFGMMKDGVVIVNTARGPCIDENALVEALESGKVYSAGLDVYEDEPVVHPGLLESEKVVLLPHIGTATYETRTTMERLVLQNLHSALNEGKLITQVPEQKKG